MRDPKNTVALFADLWAKLDDAAKVKFLEFLSDEQAPWKGVTITPPGGSDAGRPAVWKGVPGEEAEQLIAAQIKAHHQALRRTPRPQQQPLHTRASGHPTAIATPGYLHTRQPGPALRDPTTFASRLARWRIFPAARNKPRPWLTTLQPHSEATGDPLDPERLAALCAEFWSAKEAPSPEREQIEARLRSLSFLVIERAREVRLPLLRSRPRTLHRRPSTAQAALTNRPISSFLSAMFNFVAKAMGSRPHG